MDDEMDPKSRKRKQRIVLSCNDCRRRKLKCDRLLPCNRCIKGGIAGECAYDKEVYAVEGEELDPQPSKRRRQPSDEASHASANRTTHGLTTQHTLRTNANASEISQKDYVGQLEDRIATLEEVVSSFQDNIELPFTSSTASKDAVNEGTSTEVGLFKGKNYRTFYYGPTNPAVVIAHFLDLQPFMKRVYQNSTLSRLKQEQKLTEDKHRTNKRHGRVLSVPTLQSLLPDRAIVDKVIKTYFETFETTYRILHRPTFWAAYENYWDEFRAPNPDLDAIVLAILACALCISTHDTTRYEVNGFTFRSKAILWIKACEAWLRRQSNKHRTLATVQVRCLRLLALSTTCMKTKEYYQEVQQHAALMKSYGMHRDPSVMGTRCSVFEGEMRRRLWATSMELELQASIDKGIPSILSGLGYDCDPPRNVDDSELYAEMEQLPASQPLSTYTDTSFLYCAIPSITLRVRLCAHANALKPSLTSQEALQHEQDILDALNKIPIWTESHALQAWTLLDLQLRQFLVILHTPRALHVQLRSKADHRFSILTALEASTALIGSHIGLIDAENYSLCCIRSDYLRAALLICHIAYHASTAADSLITCVAKSVFDDTLEKAIRLLEERSMRPGRRNHQYWFISAAYSLVAIQLEPARKVALERLACDRVCNLLNKTRALQNDPLEESLAQEVILDESPVSTLTPMTESVVEAPPVSLSDPFTSTAPQIDSFGVGTEAWTLDDFWFMDDFQPAMGFSEKFDLRLT